MPETDIIPPQTIDPVSHLTDGELDRIEARLERLTRLLDTAYRIPLVGVRFGLDGILGLVPIAGDILSFGFSAYLLLEANRLAIPAATMNRMVGTAVFDALAGSVPLVGTVFDVLFKANVRNLAHIREHIALLRSTRARSIDASRLGASPSVPQTAAAVAVARPRPVTVPRTKDRSP